MRSVDKIHDTAHAYDALSCAFLEADITILPKVNLTIIDDYKPKKTSSLVTYSLLKGGVLISLSYSPLAVTEMHFPHKICWGQSICIQGKRN